MSEASPVTKKMTTGIITSGFVSIMFRMETMEMMTEMRMAFTLIMMFALPSAMALSSM